MISPNHQGASPLSCVSGALTTLPSCPLITPRWRRSTMEGGEKTDGLAERVNFAIASTEWRERVFIRSRASAIPRPCRDRTLDETYVRLGAGTISPVRIRSVRRGVLRLSQYGVERPAVVIGIVTGLIVILRRLWIWGRKPELLCVRHRR